MHGLRYARGTLVVLALIAALPARAAIFDDDEARRRVEDVRVRVDALERSTAARLDALESTLKSQGLVDMLRDVEQIKSDLAKLRGQYEVVSYELDQAQKRQRDLYVDLDMRLRKLETAPGPPDASAPGGPSEAPGGSGAASVPGALAPGTPPASPASDASPRFGPPGAAVAALPPLTGRAPVGATSAEQRAYDAALEQFKSSNYGNATAAFQSFVKTYPRSPLAASALYWAGNAQYAQRDYRAAIASQRQLLSTYPDSQKVPDALLNIASSQVELGDTAGAKRTLDEIVSKHPGSEAATKAKQRLAGSR